METLLVDHPGPAVTRICLNRPERRNALSTELLGELVQSVREAESRGDRAIVLTGGPRWFSSGADLAADPRVGAPSTHRLEILHELISVIVGARAVVIAAVEGYAVGAACGLVLACDLVVAAEEALLVTPFGSRGRPADGGTAYLLPRALGVQRANAHLLLGARLGAAEAHAAGLVSHLVAGGLATQEATAIAGRIAAGPPRAQASTKLLTRSGQSVGFDDFLVMERMAVALSYEGPEAEEGRRAYLERRDPEFG